MLLYKKLLLMTFGTTLVIVRLLHYKILSMLLVTRINVIGRNNEKKFATGHAHY